MSLCEPYFSRGVRVTQFIAKFIVFLETVKVQGLKDDTEYTFSIIAENAAGKSDASDTATVKTLEIGIYKYSFIYFTFCLLYFLYFKYALNLSSLKFAFYNDIWCQKVRIILVFEFLLWFYFNQIDSI